MTTTIAHAAHGIAVSETWAWTTDVERCHAMAVATNSGKIQPTVTAKAVEALTGIQLLHLGSTPATWSAGAPSADIVALDLWGDPERPGRVWAVDVALGLALRLADEVRACPDSESGRQLSSLVAVVDGAAVALVAPDSVWPWAQPDTEAGLSIVAGCEIDWQDR
jgi:hypothetical protein